jgi:hypothetical protein
MKPVLNWCKNVPLPAGNGTPEVVGRVLIHGDSTTKNGSTMELQGRHYGGTPRYFEFELCRMRSRALRHWREQHGKEHFSVKDRFPVDAEKVPGKSYYGARTKPPIQLRTKGRVVNGSWFFRDTIGSDPSSSIKTTRLGHVEIRAVEVGAGGTAAPPWVHLRFKVLMVPIKDPTLGISALVPWGREPNPEGWEAERGFENVTDVLQEDIDELREDLTSAQRNSLEAYVGQTFSSISANECGVQIEPNYLELGVYSVGSIDLGITLYHPMRLPFAIQAVSEQADGEDGVEGDDDFPDRLKGVMVSDVLVIDYQQDGSVTIE